MTNSVQTVQYPYRTFTRPKKDRVVAGVAAGLSQQLRVDVLLVRLVLVFFALLSGAGLLFYACLWIWTKPGDTSDGNAYISQDDVRIRTKHTLNRAGYLVLVVVAIAGALLSFSSLTGFAGSNVVPFGVVGVGALVVWTTYDRGLDRLWNGNNALLIVAGVLLMSIGVVLVTINWESQKVFGSTLVAVVLTLLGVAALGLPLWLRTWDALTKERSEIAAAAEREERARYARREAVRQTELATASDVEAAARVALEAAERALAQAAAERDRLSERRSQVSQEVSDARRALDRLSAELSEATASAHQGQIAAEQTRLRVEDLQRRALEELSLEPEQLLAEFGPDTLVPMLPLDPDQVEKAAAAEPSAYVRAEQERALAKAQKDLEKLGRVNPLALEEHEALAARHKFLVDQVQDLKQSKADLLRIVQDVDRLVEEAFASAFAETREQFEHVFGVLFPGGQGDLVLTDPDDMLSTGIEIEARPAGKKVKRLSLLSGGERSLAAIAFLVAIFKARPSPFYVMDEVEAALDDMNLTRLLAIFKELQETSQLIVITHQKRTMEIADALYGVTMRDGVTTVVSQRLAD